MNNKIYVGRATRFKSRWSSHLSALRNNKHHNGYLQNEFNKYGENAFQFEVIKVVEKVTTKVLAEIEQCYIDQAYGRETCYNIDKIASHKDPSVFSYSPGQTKKLKSASSKKMWLDPEYRRKISTAQKKSWASSPERRAATSKRTKAAYASGARDHVVEILKANQPRGRETFKKRMKDDPKFKKKYQEIGRRNIAKRNAEQPKKKYPLIVSPGGEVYEVHGVPTFCKTHGLTKQLLYGVLNGKSKSHKGWKLLETST